MGEVFGVGSFIEMVLFLVRVLFVALRFLVAVLFGTGEHVVIYTTPVGR